MFYFTLCALLSLIIGILQVGNIKTNDGFKKEFEGTFPYPNSEYRYMDLMLGNFFSIIRASTGDFAMIIPSFYLTFQENILFWLTFLITAIFSNIIFLNFIIAEASASYEKVSAQLQEFINKDRASLISESESMQPLIFRSPL